MSGGGSEKKYKGILTDVTRCIGCQRCVEACVHVNKLGEDLPTKTTRGDGLSGHRFTSVIEVGEYKIGQEDPAFGLRENRKAWARKQCMHCLEASCQAACLVGAFKKRDDGAVFYDEHKCIGCRYCMLACPFSIPRYNWDSPAPYIQKCRMDERCRKADGLPACVGACPAGATVFGNREDLLKEAHRRIAAEPGKYMDHVYGEHEFGGTSVMYLTFKDVPLDALGFPTPENLKARRVEELSEKSIPHMNHLWVLWTPVQFFIVFGGLFTTWFIRRRQALMSGDIHDGHGHGPGVQTAGIDEVCHVDGSESGKEGE